MRLNPDCIRDILLTIEENVGPRQYLKYNKKFANEYELLKDYEYEEVIYHIEQCRLSGFFTHADSFLSIKDGYNIHCLSPAGHQFIENIRSDTVWNRTKETAKKVGSTSLDALTKIAINVVSSIIKENM